MKKFLTLALAFVLVLALAAPALAFTGTEIKDDDKSIPYEIALRLVEYDEYDLGSIFTLPAADRGYVKGEVVCAIASLYIPKGKEINAVSGYKTWLVGGENVDLDVRDNFAARNTVGGANTTTLNLYKSTNWPAAGLDSFAAKDNEINVDLTGTDFDDPAKNTTYAFAFYGKVTGDDAVLYTKLNKGLKWANDQLVIGKDYVVDRTGDDDSAVPREFDVYAYDNSAANAANAPYGDFLFRITTGKKNASLKLEIAMKMVGGTFTLWQVGEDLRTGELFFACKANAVLDSNGDPHYVLYANSTDKALRAAYNDLISIYEDDFVEYFGFDFDLLGNAVKDKNWTSFVNKDDLYEEVAIEPWFAYVEVPPEVVVNPPKTGDAMSIVGFVMIAIAGLAVVAIRKVRA